MDKEISYFKILGCVWFVFLFPVFIFWKLFLFSKDYNLKVWLVSLLIVCFQEIKILKNAFLKGNVFLDLFKITLSPHFHFNQIEVPDFNWKRDFIVFRFWFVWKNIFIENENKNSTKHIFITIFYFQWI